jgi:hypothetical protein
MLRAIIGKPGAGKTALMTAMAVKNMMRETARKDIIDCKKNIRKFNKKHHTAFELPQGIRHLVFTDYKIEKKVYGGRNLEAHPCNGYYLALPSAEPSPNEEKPMTIPPYSHIYLDEAQTYFDADAWNKLAQEVKLFYEMHRHNCLDITYTCQRDTRIAASIRQLASEIIDIQSVQVKKGRGSFYTVWKYLSFSSTEEHEAYVKSNVRTNKRDLITFKVEGNVFKWYDSHERQDRFYKGLEKRGGFDFNIPGGNPDKVRAGFFKQEKEKGKEKKTEGGV